MSRPFASGSRQAPDPFDQFLEQKNYYRKHTARDSSCLFRVISEQMYDTQIHHLAIRKKCVGFMRKNRYYFRSLVDRDFDEYLDDLSKPKSFGTLLELQAVGLLFQRNVVLFEPFNLGNVYLCQPTFKNVFRVFYTPERHFDSVFECDFIKDVAMCQSLCYEVLYIDFFKLPDVSFAVERMLHLTSDVSDTDYVCEYDEEGYCTRIVMANGRSFAVDLPDNTNCILENQEFCHFHSAKTSNYRTALLPTPERNSDLKSIHNNIGENFDALLPNKYVSCVRQLLEEGITPFPYKVAKALDVNMYRNIEFDAWNEARKEMKLQNWYHGDTNFKVGAKCHVKLRKSDNDFYICHIQEISVDKTYCIVFIEKLGEKRLVPYDSLSPLPPDQFKPWSLPYRFHRQMQKINSVRFSRQLNCRFKLNGRYAVPPEYYTNMGMDDSGIVPAASRHDCCYKLNQFTQLDTFRVQSVEYCTMPIRVEHDLGSNSETKVSEDSTVNERGIESSLPSSNETPVEIATAKPTHEEDNSAGDPSQQQPGEETGVRQQHTAEFVEANTPGPVGSAQVPEYQLIYPSWHQICGVPEEHYGYTYDAIQASYYYMYNGTPAAPFPPPPPNNYFVQPSMQPVLAGPTAAPYKGYYAPNPYYTNVPYNAPLYSNTPVRGRGPHNDGATPGSVQFNWHAHKSIKSNGSDLPTDIGTLRYFYNLGVEYHHHFARRTAGIDNKDNVGRLTVELQNTKLNEKSDSNNNNVNMNTNSGQPYATNNSGPENNSGISFSTGGKSVPQRRPSSRYNNNNMGKDRERGGNQSRYMGGSGNNSANSQQHVQNRIAIDHGNRTGYQKYGSGSLASSESTPNSSRKLYMGSLNTLSSSMSGVRTGNNSVNSTSSVHSSTEQGIQTSPLLTMSAVCPTTDRNVYQGAENTAQPLVTYGPLEYGVDPNVLISQTAIPGAGNGVYIPVPTSYGMYPQPPMGIPPPLAAPQTAYFGQIPQAQYGPPPMHPTASPVPGTLIPHKDGHVDSGTNGAVAVAGADYGMLGSENHPANFAAALPQPPHPFHVAGNCFQPVYPYYYTSAPPNAIAGGGFITDVASDNHSVGHPIPPTVTFSPGGIMLGAEGTGGGEHMAHEDTATAGRCVLPLNGPNAQNVPR